jgi:DNA helicase-2/ATP-dependent DNA helicase PcrA
MQQRVQRLLGRRQKTLPFIATFHSLCVRVLRRHIERLGYPQRFFIAARDDQESLARAALGEVRVDDQMLRPGDLLYQISRWKSSSVTPRRAASLAQTDREHLSAVAFRRYQEALRQAGGVDFDDLLLLTAQLFREHRECREQEAGRWEHLLVDEYQDTNGIQYEIVKHLARAHRNLCVVGDDDQSIYGWRGAEVRHILRFRDDWPDARVVRLEDNYRSTAEILAYANQLIAMNRTRHPKQLRSSRTGGSPPRLLQLADEQQEAVEIVRAIADLQRQPGVRWADCVILCRTNEQPRVFESELRRRNVPYVLIGSQSFFDRKEVKDLLSYLRLVVAPSDEMALRRIVNTPARGIGPAAFRRLEEDARHQQHTLWAELQHRRQSPQQGSAAMRRGTAELTNAIDRAQKGIAAGQSLVEIASRLLADVRYRDAVDAAYSDPDERERRWLSVEQLVNALAEYCREAASAATLDEFLDQVALDGRDFETDDKESKLGRNAVALMTLHSAKGLEFPYVFMVGMEEGVLPHHRSIGENEDGIAEERRLCYVGITRAQEQLTLSLALTRMKWGKPRETIPSRFLYEMTGKTDHPNYAARIANATPDG